MEHSEQAEVLEGFNSLTQDLLAKVLQHVPQDARLRDCACVSTTWHAATLASLHSLKADRLYMSEASALPAWLSKYGPAANISQLDLQLQPDPSTEQTDDSSDSPRAIRALLGSCSSTFGEVLPAVRGLGCLQLSGLWREPVLATLSRLQDLQELSLQGDGISNLPALPVSLTALKVKHSHAAYLHDLFRHDLDDPDAPAQPPPVPFTALGGLTNLQALTVSCRRVSVSFDDVAQLLQLRTCILGFRSLPGLIPETQRRPTGLAQISKLTALQHLSLAEWVCPDVRPAQELGLTAADCAALTASSQLTFLDLSMWQLGPELCSAAFPPKLQLPLLQELRAGPCFVQDPAATAAVVGAAPNLSALKVSAVDCTVYEYQEHYEAEVLGEVACRVLSS